MTAALPKERICWNYLKSFLQSLIPLLSSLCIDPYPDRVSNLRQHKTPVCLGKAQPGKIADIFTLIEDMKCQSSVHLTQERWVTPCVSRWPHLVALRPSILSLSLSICLYSADACLKTAEDEWRGTVGADRKSSVPLSRRLLRAAVPGAGSH